MKGGVTMKRTIKGYICDKCLLKDELDITCKSGVNAICDKRYEFGMCPTGRAMECKPVTYTISITRGH